MQAHEETSPVPHEIPGNEFPSYANANASSGFEVNQKDLQIAFVILVISVVLLYNMLYHWVPIVYAYWKSLTEPVKVLKKLEETQKSRSSLKYKNRNQTSSASPDININDSNNNDEKPIKQDKKFLLRRPSSVNETSSGNVSKNDSQIPLKEVSKTDTVIRKSVAKPSVKDIRAESQHASSVSIESSAANSTGDNPWTRYAVPSPAASSLPHDARALNASTARREHIEAARQLRREQDQEYIESQRRDEGRFQRLEEERHTKQLLEEEQRAAVAAMLVERKELGRLVPCEPPTDSEVRYF